MAVFKILLIKWLTAVITFLAPVDMKHYLPEAMETVDQAKERREQIATAIVNVVWDEDEKPIFSGKFGRARTAMLLVGIAYMESGFRKDIDTGVGKMARGDFGKSWCPMQMNLGKKKVQRDDGTWFEDSAEKTPEGWSGRDLVTDREKCYRAGLHAARGSILKCSVGLAKKGTRMKKKVDGHVVEVTLEEDQMVPLPFGDKLSAYATGSCLYNQAHSRSRIAKSFQLFEKFPPPAEPEKGEGFITLAP